MAFTYTIKPSGGDSHQSAPYWFAAFVRFAEKDTFTRKSIAPSDVYGPQQETVNSSKRATSRLDPVAELPQILIADGDVVSWSTTSAKDQHVSNCQLNLAASDTNYVRELASGDWMGFWAFDNKDDFERVRKQVLNRDQANGFNDGFKFLGRVDSVRKVIDRQPGGILTIQYSITGIGFSEFDSIIYYNPALAAKYSAAVSEWMMELGSGVNDLIAGIEEGEGLVGSNKIIPQLMRILLGLGPEKASKGIRPDQNAGEFINPEELESSANRAYLVPKTVGGWILGREVIETKKQTGLTYADLLKMYVGIQKYGSGVQSSDTQKDDGGAYNGFLVESFSRLSGDYRATVTPFDGKPVWSILLTYLNDPIDELYTCLRVDKNGNVMPTLVARQNPMSTKWFSDRTNKDFPTTAFTELPRWEIDTDLILHLEVGRSNVPRTNFIHYQGQDMGMGNVYAEMGINYTRNPPIIDPDDIARSGLKMHSKVLSANVFAGTNQSAPGGKWQKIMADILMGSHLKFSGTLNSKFIQQPVPEGDNLVVDGNIYHIERVIHSGNINLLGTKDASTTIMLTNGISLENDTNTDKEIIYPDTSDEADPVTIEQN